MRARHMREVACGRGRAEDNRARVVLERVPPGRRFPPPLDNRAQHPGEPRARLPTAPTGPAAMKRFEFLEEDPER
jgi:hypothetical protein